MPVVAGTIGEGLRKHHSRPNVLVPDSVFDRRGQVPSEAECRAIEKKYGLGRGCTLVMNGDRWFYDSVGTWGEEPGEKPCLLAYKYYRNGSTSEDLSLLNVWRVG